MYFCTKKTRFLITIAALMGSVFIFTWISSNKNDLSAGTKNTTTASPCNTDCTGTTAASPNNNYYNKAEKTKPKIFVAEVPTRMRSQPILTTIVLPSSYNDDNKAINHNRSSAENTIGVNRKQQFYSVLYMLHGAGASHGSWVKKSSIADFAESYNIIVVCPDGNLSWYIDSPVDPRSQYETFVSSELITYLDQRYRTKSTPRHRAILGNSMGGYGALLLGMRHSEVFGTVVALSGGVDFRQFPKNWNKWNLPSILGPIEENRKLWNDSTIETVVEQWASNFPLPKRKNGWRKGFNVSIALDVGLDDFFLGVNRNLRDKMLQLRIPHHYSERPGIHNWNYWESAIRYQMAFINEQFVTY